MPADNDIVKCVITSNASCITGSPATSNEIVMSVLAVGNNTIDFVHGVNGVICATVTEYNSAVLTAPAGTAFTRVNFASYGTPTGTCPDFVIGSCHAVNSQAIAEGYLLGNNSASIPAGNWIFGEPCPNTAKQLYIAASYTEPVCSGTLPGTITGSLPLVGGTLTYLWESSITSASVGFTTAPGTNDAKDYTPPALNQTTWFRRLVTSGGVTDTSNVILIKVTTCVVQTANTIDFVSGINGTLCATAQEYNLAILNRSRRYRLCES